MSERRKARHLATVLAPLLGRALALDEPPDSTWLRVLPLDDELVATSVLHEVRHLGWRTLPAGTVTQMRASDGAPPNLSTRDVRRLLERQLSEHSCASRTFLWLLLTSDRRAFKALLRSANSGEEGNLPHGKHGRVQRRLREVTSHLFGRREAPPTRPRLMAAWVSRQVIALILNGIIALVVATSLYSHFGWDSVRWWDLGLLKLFAVWAMSFLPGWLFVRFLGQRARALWWDFVLALHRLGVDEPEFLPEPPFNSQYYSQWLDAGGGLRVQCDSIYREKFDAYYGKQVSRMGVENQTTKVWSETLFPVILLTAVLAVGWTAVLWDTSFAASPSGPFDMLKFGFLGAYAFIVQMLIRRYFQSDLRASAYASAVVRIFLVAIVVAVIHQLPGLQDRPAQEAVVAFVVGFFPIVGMQALQRIAATVLRQAVPSLNPAYPLNQIDGLNVWYESRLLEEGIEDMQNLTTTNLVDVLLHTHVPVGRLVDWIDQAHLYQRLDRAELSRKERRESARRTEGDGPPEGTVPGARRRRTGRRWTANATALEDSEGFRFGTRQRHALRRMGVRTATDLLKIMPLPLSPADDQWLVSRGLDPYAMAKLVTALKEEAGLRIIRRWQRGAGVDPEESPEQAGDRAATASR